MTAEEAFERHRGLLFTVAYEMLGSAADAEDVVHKNEPSDLQRYPP